jgi:hypothetical protein
MIKKDIDIKSLVKKSVDQVYETRMPKQLNEQTPEEERGRFPGSKRTLFDLFPFFQTSKKTFSVQSSAYPNEQLFRQIFANISNENISFSIQNLNNILGITVREDGSHDFIEDASKRDISDTFSALSIVSNMYLASKANESMTGHLFEPLIAGLLNGRAVGYKNDIEDIVVDQKYTNGVDGNKVTPQQYSLKVVKDKFNLSTAGILARLNDASFASEFKFNVIVILKKDTKIANSLASVYNFYKIIINKENFIQSLYTSKQVSAIAPPGEARKKQWREDKLEKKKQNLNSIFDTLETYIKSILPSGKKETHTPIQKKTKELWDSFKQKWVELSKEEELDISKIYKDFDFLLSNNPDVGEAYKNAKKGSTGFSSDEEPENEEQILPEGNRASVKVGESLWKNMDPQYLGSILLGREVYESRLKQEEGGLVNKFIELLLPLQNALDNTNEYFLQKDVGAKVQNLQKAQQETEKFKQAADAILNPKQPSQGSLEESLDLTDEAKMVIELIESYNRRNNG